MIWGNEELFSTNMAMDNIYYLEYYTCCLCNPKDTQATAMAFPRTDSSGSIQSND